MENVAGIAVETRLHLSSPSRLRLAAHLANLLSAYNAADDVVPFFGDHIVFDDGLSAEIDFEPHLVRGPVFEPLKDIEYFKKATIEGGTTSCPNGADISSESQYERVESANDRSHADRPSASLRANR